ncbi:Holliday junction resolvase RuvX, partial [Candidatus Saccharibacteria bacterium]|nr:Holliday junction resolvase RuvX [Candidatus Saccharibacteria bacterium]
MEAKEILGIDLGAERTGIARASNVARLAEPLMSVPTKDAISTIRKYTSEHKVEAIAIGLPRNLSGEETKQT